jgi:lysophospholipase L1-like esterase
MIKKFQFEVFKSSITIVAIALVGCASKLEIHQGLATTTPVTQNRDYAIYDWQSRHAAVLEYNRTHQPEIVIIGDSIVHYWGGDPAAPKAWASDVWNRTFAGRSVENLGFGWDRTENVLWRLDHGELDGISPKLIIIKIGTNNTGINRADEIADGIEAVCARVHEVQPHAKILLLGILPRRDEIPSQPAITDRVNQIVQIKLGKISWIHYRDFRPAFRKPDGSVNAALFADGVHPNHAGYEILGNLIREEIVRILN